MNPPLRARGRPASAARGSEGRDDRGDRHRPRAARTSREGRSVRGGALRRHRPRDGVLGALHAPRRAGDALARRADRPHECRAGPHLRAGAAADRGRRARQSRRPRPRADVARRRERLPVALAQLLAPRPDPQRQGRRDRRQREAGVLAHDRLPGPRRRVGLPRPVGRRPRCRLRGGGLHDRDDGLPGDRHRPELRGAARLLHGADGRELRRLSRALRVDRGARAGGAHAPGHGPGVAALAGRPGHRRARGDRHALPRPPPAAARGHARGCRGRATPPSRRCSPRCG